MGLICSFCYLDLGSRTNFYGTICPKCGAFIKNEAPAPLRKKAENLLKQQQDQIRQFLRKKILGDINGN